MSEITVSNNGPYTVTGAGIILKDATGKSWDLGGRATIALCRCGHSAIKPFCDGSHRAAGFESKVEAGVLGPPKPKV